MNLLSQSIRVMTMLGILSSLACAQTKKAPPAMPVDGKFGEKLTYRVEENGDRMVDFSYAGYRAGEAEIPNIEAKILVGKPLNDNTGQIQAAIDAAANLPLDDKGFRAAVLLPPGKYPVSGQIRIHASGIVLRGSGMGENGTSIIATGTDRRPLIMIEGQANRSISPTTRPVQSNYTPVNSTTLKLAANHGFEAGETVVIRRPSTANWIADLKMDDLGGDRHGPSWKPGSRDVQWDRIVTKVTSDSITIDAPITQALDSKYGNGTVASYTWPGRITNCGVENLLCESISNPANPKDEDHSWYAVTMENAADCWVRRVTAIGFSGSAVAVWETCKRVTVEDCKYLQPVSEIGGWRRNAFFTTGQQVLMQRLYSEDARHDFGVGYCAAGPNAFVQCESVRSLGESGAIDSWSVGTLFDRVRIDGRELSLRNREYRGKGQGWSAANSVLWDCSAAVIECPRPPTAQNYAIGTWGEFSGDGYWYGSDDSAPFESLYYAQRADRLKKNDAKLLFGAGEGSRAPTIDAAAASIKEAYAPRKTVGQFIDELAKENPIPVDASGLTALPFTPIVGKDSLPPRAFKITNGWVTVDGAIIHGPASTSPWWRGSVNEPGEGDAITRFVPGRTGEGRTDDIDDLTQSLASNNNLGFIQHPPLWYERRRDDHERVQRADGDVVAPFYEWPFARSGQGTAYDGLSKWDLTKPNPFYYSRLQQFARKGAPLGLMLIEMHYMQHSILEAGGHYADFPWRSANNINDMLLPEPPNYAGDKLIYIGEQFYDVSIPSRAALHKQYIRTQLDQFKDLPNVIHLTSDEFTGDLRFTQFWIDTIAEWEKETGRHPIIGLYAPKDVTDAILADHARSPTVDLIYNFYDKAEASFFYQTDGSLYAPKGGLNLSPRQQDRFFKPKGTSFSLVYKLVREYREKYPDKPFVYRGDPNMAWAVIMAGGSMASLNANLDPALKTTLARTRPIDLPGTAMALGNGGKDFVIYADGNNPITITLAPGNYTVQAINPRGGETVSLGDVTGGNAVTLPVAKFSPAVVWVSGK